MPSLAPNTGYGPRSPGCMLSSVLQDMERPTAPWYPQAVELSPLASPGSPWRHQALRCQEMQIVSILSIPTPMKPSLPAGVTLYMPSSTL